MRLGASWGRLGAVLGRLEALKNASWERLGDVLERLGASKNATENKADLKSENRACTIPRRNYFWEPKSSQNRSKTRSTRLLFCIIFSIHFFFDLGSIFPPNLAPKMERKSKKIDAKTNRNFGAFQDRFLIRF